MIAASLPQGEDLVDVLLSKEADVNAKSKFSHLATSSATASKEKRMHCFDADYTFLRI